MKKLKTVTIQIPFDERYKDFFDKIEKYELFEIHRLDNEIIVATQLFRFKDANFKPKDLIGINGIEFIEILTEDKIKREYICFVKHRWPKELHDFFTDSELIMNAPIVSDNNMLTVSFIIDDSKMDKLQAEFQRLGTHCKVLSISTKVPPNLDNVFMLLTERQREIIFYAVENGYYEIPRKINTDDLAKKFGMTQSALSEHLRKIERLVFNTLFNK
jgi:hypothetical protein